MTWDAISKDRVKAFDSLKAEWDKLTDDDISIIIDRREQLEHLLQAYYGYDQSTSRSEVDRWLRQFQ